MERDRMMKKVNVKFYIASFEQFKDLLQRVLLVFSGKAISHLEINLVMDTLGEDEIEKILNYINTYHTFKDISNDTIYTFVATVNPSVKLYKLFSKIKSLLSRIDLICVGDFSYVVNVIDSLQKKRFPTSLIITGNNSKEALERYKNYSSIGIPVFFEGELCYNDEYVSLFWEWVYDQNGCRINIFADVLSKILLNYWGTICQYKSCLTKYFVVNENGEIHSCKANNIAICNLCDITSMDELISQENFIILLKSSIAKRSQCREYCNFYGICQGGCPLDAATSIEDCKNKQLFLAMEEITERVRRIVNDSDYRDLNPAVREMILSSVASNKLFEKRLFV